jgi:hypothetical protein
MLRSFAQVRARSTSAFVAAASGLTYAAIGCSTSFTPAPVDLPDAAPSADATNSDSAAAVDASTPLDAAATDAALPPPAPWTDDTAVNESAFPAPGLATIAGAGDYLYFGSNAGATRDDGWVYRCERRNCSATLGKLNTPGLSYPLHAARSLSGDAYMMALPEYTGATSPGNGVYTGFGARLEIRANGQYQVLPKLSYSREGNSALWFMGSLLHGKFELHEASAASASVAIFYTVPAQSFNTLSVHFAATEETAPYRWPTPGAPTNIPGVFLATSVCHSILNNAWCLPRNGSAANDAARINAGFNEFRGLMGDVGGRFGAVREWTNGVTPTLTLYLMDEQRADAIGVDLGTLKPGADILGTNDWVWYDRPAARFRRISAAALQQGRLATDESTVAIEPAPRLTPTEPLRTSNSLSPATIFAMPGSNAIVYRGVNKTVHVMYF